MVEVEIAVAKVPRHGATESGDTVEIVERPGGGMSVVLVDGQGNGRGAKTLSNLIVTRAIGQIKDGARDGVVARAAHDYLYTYRHGQAAATINILSVDFASATIRVSRNNPAPFFVLSADGARIHDEPSVPIGLHPMTKPRITEIALRPDLCVLLFSDGLLKVGESQSEDLELPNWIAGWQDWRDARSLSDSLLRRALEIERGAPGDDISIVALATRTKTSDDQTRRMHVTMPALPPAEALGEPWRDDVEDDDLG